LSKLESFQDWLFLVVGIGQKYFGGMKKEERENGKEFKGKKEGRGGKLCSFERAREKSSFQ